MKEQLISFETAKLAKEKGFNVQVSSHYDNVFKIHHIHLLDNFNSRRWTNGYYSAPTQSLLQKWLREKYFFCVTIQMYEKDGVMKFECWVSFRENCYFDKFQNSGFISYEEALEAGLFEALKLIKNKVL